MTTMHPAHTGSSHTSAHLQAATHSNSTSPRYQWPEARRRSNAPNGRHGHCPTACTVTEQRLHAYERQRSETVTAIRTRVPPADAGARRVESASGRRACKREKCNDRRNQTKFNGRITTTRADLESSGLEQQRRDRQESAGHAARAHRLRQRTLLLPQRTNKQQQR
jgi:hypothetical protein